MNNKKKLANKAKVLEGHGLRCEDCGKQGVDVKHTTCPFDEDVHNRITKCDLCPGCENNRAQDI
jgi:hypothetical protein